MDNGDNAAVGDNIEPSRKPPIRIPLDFETAVEGLLQVDPRKSEDDNAKEKPNQK